ncbi:hypothetical protein NLG97_g10877 [Lecanicillium saksenae]|uniref:Uncharacterized protein n=1 Tax=Lecanicillium saksenae TaxID=468837 RepID=A0ACC1QCG9_9HYPO|nr:hypothetical protein NLG97_g10877 [Lecanicillium saksenae]
MLLCGALKAHSLGPGGILWHRQRAKLVVQPARKLCRVSPHDHDRRRGAAIDARCRLAADAGEALRLRDARVEQHPPHRARTPSRRR